MRRLGPHPGGSLATSDVLGLWSTRRDAVAGWAQGRHVGRPLTRRAGSPWSSVDTAPPARPTSCRCSAAAATGRPARARASWSSRPTSPASDGPTTRLHAPAARGAGPRRQRLRHRRGAHAARSAHPPGHRAQRRQRARRRVDRPLGGPHGAAARRLRQAGRGGGGDAVVRALPQRRSTAATSGCCRTRRWRSCAPTRWRSSGRARCLPCPRAPRRCSAVAARRRSCTAPSPASPPSTVPDIDELLVGLLEQTIDDCETWFGHEPADVPAPRWQEVVDLTVVRWWSAPARRGRSRRPARPPARGRSARAWRAAG